MLQHLRLSEFLKESSHGHFAFLLHWFAIISRWELKIILIIKGLIENEKE